MCVCVCVSKNESGPMALIKCEDCGRDVSQRAPACPNCGGPIATLVKQASVPDKVTVEEENFPEDGEVSSATVSETVTFKFKWWSAFWLPMMALAVFTKHPGWAFLCLVFWCFWPLIKRGQEADTLWNTVRPDFEFKGTDRVRVRVDMAGQKFATRNKDDVVRIIEGPDLMQIDIERNGSSVQTTRREASATGAVAGALLGGGVGAMVGMGMGNSTTTTRDFVHSVSLRITVRDPDSPFIRVWFLDSKKSLPSHSRYVQSAMHSAEIWRARFSMLLT